MPTGVTTYNLTIDDTSPQIVYLPPTLTNATATPDLLGGWNEYYNGTGFNAYPGQLGRNASWHVTSRDGAALSVQFKGTAISIYGQAYASSFSVAVDGTTTYEVAASPQAQPLPLADAEPVLLASVSGLAQQTHVLTFTVHTSTNDSEGVMVFDRAVVTVSTGLTNAAVSSKIINDTSLQFTGSWSPMNVSALASESSPDRSYHITNSLGDQASYTFQGSSIELNGLTNASSGLFSITLSSDSDSSSIQQQQLSGQSSFFAPATLFYASGLDRNATHTLTVTNLENKTLALQDLSITVVQGDESSTAGSSTFDSMRLSKGEIAAIAVASSLAFLILLGLSAILYCCYKRRQRSKHLRRRLSEDPRLSIRAPTRISWAVANLGPTHARSGQRWSAPGGTLTGYDQPAPAYDSNITEIPRNDIEDNDAESDSGIGHGLKKKETFLGLGIPILESAPPQPEPILSSRSRSRTLARLSGWFTSSTGSSRSRERRAADAPVAAPQPVRLQELLAVLSREHGADSRKAANDDASSREAYLDLQVARTSPFQVDFEKHGHDRIQEASTSEQRRTSITASLAAQARDILVSFLDFASSGGTSRRESIRSRSRRPSISNKSTTHSAHDNDRSTSSGQGQDSSGQSQNAPTTAWTLSPVDPPPQRPTRGPQLLVPTSPTNWGPSAPVSPANGLGPGRHPFSMVSADLQLASPTSPTDSLPMSVSEINFRADEEDDSAGPEGERGERVGRVTQLPRHPPLPGTPHSYDFAAMSAPREVTPSHMRQMSAPNLGLAAQEQQRPYVAQTSLGRRLVQVRAQALESQRLETAASTEQSGTRLSSPTTPSSRVRILPIPFIHFGRHAGGS